LRQEGAVRGPSCCCVPLRPRQVYCTHTEPNFSLAWQKRRQSSSTSSGFVLRHAGRQFLLTNAHSVDYGVLVRPAIAPPGAVIVARLPPGSCLG
jgi:hypothetical protein